jgi:hypothetical protein
MGWNRVYATEEKRGAENVLARWGAGGGKAPEAPALPDLSGTFGHRDAGLLRLIAKGAGGWFLKLQDCEFGVGPVGRRERLGDVLRPSRRTLDKAAEIALREGPENPPGAQVFAEGRMVTVAEWMIAKGMVQRG